VGPKNSETLRTNTGVTPHTTVVKAKAANARVLVFCMLHVVPVFKAGVNHTATRVCYVYDKCKNGGNYPKSAITFLTAGLANIAEWCADNFWNWFMSTPSPIIQPVIT
jgi:hypothetical protein